MYGQSISELKARSRDQMMSMAVRSWKTKGLGNDEIADKIARLDEWIDRAGKKQFVIVYNKYCKGGIGQ